MIQVTFFRHMMMIGYGHDPCLSIYVLTKYGLCTSYYFDAMFFFVCGKIEGKKQNFISFYR